MGLFTDNFMKKHGPSAKNKPYFTQNMNFATTVPSNMLGSNMIPYVNKFFDFFYNLLDPFPIRTTHNCLLPSGPKFYNNFENNYTEIDSILSNQISLVSQDSFFGFQLLKSLEFEHPLTAKAKSLKDSFDGILMSNLNLLNYKTPDFVKMSKGSINSISLYSESTIQCDMAQVTKNNLVIPRETYLLSKSECEDIKTKKFVKSNKSCEDKKFIKNCILKSQIIAKMQLDSAKIVEKSTFIKKMPTNLNVTCVSSKKSDSSMETFNQELIIRKNKKMSKLSKKKRKRQRKKTQAVENLNSKCGTNDQNKNQILNDGKKKLNKACSKFDDVDQIIFEEHLMFNDSTTVHSEIEKNICSNPLLSFIFCQTSYGESDSDFESDCDITTISHENVFEEDFIGGLSSLCIVQTNLTSNDASIIDDASEMCAELKEINFQWQKNTVDVPSKPKTPTKVTFASDEKLFQVFPVEIYDRKGEWETFVTERCHFKRRIKEFELLLSPYLSPSHRDKIRTQQQNFY